MIVASSFAISKRFERHSMDVKELAKGHAFTSNKDTNVLATFTSIIQTDYLQ
jgi:CIC family chloride channel protein